MRFLPLLVILAACGNDGPGPRPTLDQVERVVFVGDNSATSPAYGTSFARLLVANDDGLFPEFAGADLSTRLGVDAVDLAKGGDSYHALVQLEEPVAGAGGDGRALVVVSLGINDVLDILIRMFVDNGVRADPQPTLDELRMRIAAFYAAIDESVSPRPLLVVVTPYDPSDGVGDLADVAATFYPTINPSLLPAEILQPVIEQFYVILAEEAVVAEAVLVDARAHFMGHGYHFDDTLWLQNLLDANPRGAHELRRVTWNTLTGENLDTEPGALPPGDDGLLPPMTDAGWANEVVDHAITETYLDYNEREWVNIGGDPLFALGAPDGDNTTALGIVGAWMVLDLGAGEEAVDGPGHDLVILEQGASSGGAPEPYRLLVANAPDGPWTIVGDGRGERGFDLAPSGVSSARYLRLESHAHIPDVLSGFGSPVYPGPEFDAAGAVYPGGAGI